MARSANRKFSSLSFFQLLLLLCLVVLTNACSGNGSSNGDDDNDDSPEVEECPTDEERCQERENL
ncbi:MAG: hypothetical protein GVY04_23010 [Cyanobacteria bacterium]|jgi:hypothetical protein|nr:hypothetical protein [Cyanobacteria bacterium GSL.Bin1]